MWGSRGGRAKRAWGATFRGGAQPRKPPQGFGSGAVSRIGPARGVTPGAIPKPGGGLVLLEQEVGLETKHYVENQVSQPERITRRVHSNGEHRDDAASGGYGKVLGH